MDKTDREIIEVLLEKDMTAYEIAQALEKTTDEWALRKKSSFLRYRLGRLAQDGLVRKNGGGKYHVPLEDMIYGKAKLLIENGQSAFTLDLGKVLVTEKGEEHIILILKK